MNWQSYEIREVSVFAKGRHLLLSFEFLSSLRVLKRCDVDV